jgi:hypothetical protein
MEVPRTPSCHDLHVFVYEATEPISSQWPDGRAGAWVSAACGRVLTQRSVRAMRVVTSMKVRGAAVSSIRLLLLSPCRSVGGLPGEPSNFGECFGTLSWHIHDGRADGIHLSARPVLSLRYIDRAQPSTPGTRS